MANAVFVSAMTVIVITLALYGAYMAGLFDGVEQYVAFYFVKAKAKAQEKKLKSLGKVEGVDFTKGELPGNKQAESIAHRGMDGIGENGFGGVSDRIGGLKGGGIGDGVGGLKKGLC